MNQYNRLSTKTEAVKHRDKKILAQFLLFAGASRIDKIKPLYLDGGMDRRKTYAGKALNPEPRHDHG
ncbi:hypothetical protein JYT87_00625 [Nitrospira defluvii]|nr:hypothetical protein [Nitrospira defluvii]